MRDFREGKSSPPLERAVDAEYAQWTRQVDRVFQGAQVPSLDVLLNAPRLAKPYRLWLSRQGVSGPLISLLGYEPLLRKALSAGGWRVLRVALHDEQFRRLFDESYVIEAESFDQHHFVLRHCSHQPSWRPKQDTRDPRDGTGHWFFWWKWGHPPDFCRPHSDMERQRRYARKQAKRR